MSFCIQCADAALRSVSWSWQSHSQLCQTRRCKTPKLYHALWMCAEPVQVFRQTLPPILAAEFRMLDYHYALHSKSWYPTRQLERTWSWDTDQKADWHYAQHFKKSAERLQIARWALTMLKACSDNVLNRIAPRGRSTSVLAFRLHAQRNSQ
jgi:hypothetical protein